MDESGKVAQSLKLGLVGPLPPPSGGMANQTRQLAALLEGEGVAVEIIQVNAPYRPAWAGSIKGLRALFRLFPYLMHLWRAAGRSDVFHVMANSGWSWHLFAAPAAWIAAWRGTPVVVNYRGGEAEEFFEESFRWVRPTLNRVAAVAVPTGFLADVFARRGIDTLEIPNIIDVERFRPGEGDAAPNDAAPDSPHVIVTRNLEPIYDIGSALRAFKRVTESLPGARMSIAGSGPERERLAALADSLGIAECVCFTGRLEPEAMADLYAGADVMLNPSLADNMPNSILEALASAVPVVSTNVGGVPFLVKHEQTALLVEPGNDQAMADAILQACSDRSLRMRLVANGVEMIQAFTWPRVREQWIGLYARLSGGGRQPVRGVS